MSVPKLRHPERSQISFYYGAIDDLISHDHPVRLVWEFVKKLDLSAFHDKIRSRQGARGASAFDPRMLLALWVWATLHAVGSARELERLCKEHLTYRWLCGGLEPNHHSLSDFRTSHVEELEELLINTVATLLNEEIVTMECVAQDGMRVRASAGSSSFRRKETLERLREEARQQIEQLRQELKSNASCSSKRQKAAQLRAARENQEKIENALKQFEEIKKMEDLEKMSEPKNEDETRPPETPEGADEKASSKKKKEPRASTTDPEARVMKMPDGGFRPAYNCQFITDKESGMILGADVVNSGSDSGQMSPMLEKLEQAYGKRAQEILVDQAYVQSHDEIVIVQKSGTTVYAPKKPQRPAPKKRSKSWAAKRPEQVKEFENRMEEDEAKEKLRKRGEVAELVHAQARERGLWQFPVRGREKAKGITLLYAVTHNINRVIRMQWLGRFAS